MYLVNSKQIRQQNENRFVAKSATMLVFTRYFEHSIAQNHTKNRQNCGIRNKILQNPEVCGIHKQTMTAAYCAKSTEWNVPTIVLKIYNKKNFFFSNWCRFFLRGVINGSQQKTKEYSTFIVKNYAK